MKIRFTLLMLIWFTVASAQSKPKYIFLFIGDGMGLAQTSLTEYYMQSMQKKAFRLQMNTLPVHGLITTHSQSNTITCSAAAGTALACGFKTSNGTIGMDSAHKTNYESVATVAKRLGKKVGIITSVSIDHATPSVFYAHSGSRDDYYEIASQLPNSGFDFFCGGAFLDPNGNKSLLPKPHVNSNELAIKAGYKYVRSISQFKSLKRGESKILAIDTALWHNDDIAYAIDRKPDALSLADVTSKAIEVLDNENGFFVMVEGGKIDWACHNNDARAAIGELLDFDNAVGEALRFAESHPGEALVIVTADHETGGLALGFTDTKYDSYFNNLSYQTMSFQNLNYKVQVLRKQNIAFESVIDSLGKYCGLSTKIKLSERDRELLKTAYLNPEKETMGISYSKGLDAVTSTSLSIIAHKSGIAWSSTAHSASPVPIRALGTGQELFSGYQENTSVAQHIFELMKK